MTDLAQLTCGEEATDAPALDSESAAALLSQLQPDWRIDGARLVRRYETQKFAGALIWTNAVGYVAETQGHHPDIKLGWGYCEVRLTTHDVGGLSRKDFIVAAKLDAMGA